MQFGRIRSRHRLILLDCRTSAVSRHTSPPNLVKINVSTPSGNPGDGCEQAEGASPLDCLVTAVDAKLGVDVPHVGGDRVH